MYAKIDMCQRPSEHMLQARTPEENQPLTAEDIETEMWPGRKVGYLKLYTNLQQPQTACVLVNEIGKKYQCGHCHL